MSSPFPGMDPYLERHWGDVHTRLIVYCSDQLRSRLPKELRVRAEESVAVQSQRDSGSTAPHDYPDVRIIERRPQPGQAPDSTGLAVAEPLLVPAASEPRTERRVTIIDTTAANRVVTVIEFLSPWNKRSPGRDRYRAKQRDLLDGGVSLVEIDLTRSGDWVLAAPEHDVPEDYRAPYAICVTRAGASHFEVYRTSLRAPLPTILIPLRPSDSDVPLEIQAIIDLVYENGGYEDDIDYHRPLAPRLSVEDEQWARELLVQRGLIS